MKEFKKYQHLERFGTSEVNGIEIGECYIFPKIDGTNASVWLGKDGIVQAGSRKRHLSVSEDNAGFYSWVLEQDNIRDYLLKNPNHTLYGEWLVPHSLKTYRDDKWEQFYIFDVCEHKDESVKYLKFKEYEPLLKEYGLEYIPPIRIIRNPTYDNLNKCLEENKYLIKDGYGTGEGIVVKNYDFSNKYGRTTWAKLVTSEFKEKHSKEMGSPITENKLVEESIAKEFVTKALCEKTYSKINNEKDFSSKNIPQLLNTIYYDLVREDIWEILKKFNFPTINFKTLKSFVFIEVKTKIPEVFSK